MRKNLYLDFDGVLNSREWFKFHYHREKGLDLRALNCVDEIYRRSGCDIIVISAWARWMIDGDMTKRGFQQMLWSHGWWIDENKLFHFDKRADDPDKRAAKILDWQDKNPGNWAVIDDCDMTEYLPKENFFRIDSNWGIQPKHIERVLRVLNAT